MSSELEDAIQEWIDDRDDILNGKFEDALFVSQKKKRISQKSISNVVYKYTEEALGYRISPHKLRAAFANIMLNKTNGNIYIVQQLLLQIDKIVYNFHYSFLQLYLIFR